MKLTASIRRKYRVRNKLKKISSNDRLRLSITRSIKNISAQIIDDKNQSTILSASSNEKDMRSAKKNKTDLSILFVEKFEKKPKKKNITKFYFERVIYKYKGKVKAFAEI